MKKKYSQYQAHSWHHGWTTFVIKDISLVNEEIGEVSEKIASIPPKFHGKFHLQAFRWEKPEWWGKLRWGMHKAVEIVLSKRLPFLYPMLHPCTCIYCI